MLIVRECDRSRRAVTRRHFLTAGAVGVGGLTLASMLRAEAEAGIRSSRKAIINLHLDGGPSQLDTIDMKPDAPREVRGSLGSMPTSLSGFRICEFMPKVAALAEKFVFLRSLVGAAGQHDAFQCLSGFDRTSLTSIGGRPAMGSILSRLNGSTTDAAPPFVDLMQGRALVRNSARPGFLGAAYGPFRPDMSKLFLRPLEDGMKKELSALGDGHVTSLALLDALSPERLRRRLGLLEEFDAFRRQVDAKADSEMVAMDRFTQQAFGILTSGRLAEAMDLGRENPRVLEAYTLPARRVERFKHSDDDRATLKALLARRLVEAGVRCVSVSLSDFDTHTENDKRMRHLLPILDHMLATLVTDLERRGMLDDVTVIAWGEFGRTPRIDTNGAGRHHWQAVAPAILAGGGMKTGQVIGATDRHAAEVVSRPLHYQDVIATLYHNLGIDLDTTTIEDPSGRPQYLLDRGQPIAEVV